MRNMKKAYIFDIDNTLYSYDNAHKIAFYELSKYAFEHFVLDEEAFRTLHKNGDFLLRSHVGTVCAAVHNRLIRYQIMLETIGQPIYHAPVMAKLYWDTLMEHMQPEPGVQECFKCLKSAGFMIGIGTDMTADRQFEKLERLGLLGDVDFMVSSEEAGAEKPDERLFRLCVEKAGVKAEECVFVGDSLKKDVMGAKNAGMCPVWYHPAPLDEAELPEGVRVIHSFKELSAL